MRATIPFELMFVDHVEFGIGGKYYPTLILVDAASNYVWAVVQRDKSIAETCRALRMIFEREERKPKTLVGDQYFHSDAKWQEWYSYHNVRPIALGPYTPWPNRAEAAVKTVKHHVVILIDSLSRYATEEPIIGDFTVEEAVSAATSARNKHLTYELLQKSCVAFQQGTISITRT